MSICLFKSDLTNLASLIASPLGANLGEKVNPSVLQIIMGILIFATAVKSWLEVL
ncbi:hypothetical protein [Neobacillus drentensis]|uniref:hypothetical protein n=1 Tax=Neobacillus drentensis TaxID=220684 RepID=UPI003B5864DC